MSRKVNLPVSFGLPDPRTLLRGEVLAPSEAAELVREKDLSVENVNIEPVSVKDAAKDVMAHLEAEVAVAAAIGIVVARSLGWFDALRDASDEALRSVALARLGASSPSR